MCGLLRSERTMQLRPKSKRGRRLGPAVYHPSQYLQTCIKRAPAPVTGNPNLLNNSTECFRCKPSVEFVGAPPSTLPPPCFFVSHRQREAVLSVFLYSSLVLQQSLLISTAPVTTCIAAMPGAVMLPMMLLQQRWLPPLIRLPLPASPHLLLMHALQLPPVSLPVLLLPQVLLPPPTVLLPLPHTRMLLLPAPPIPRPVSLLRLLRPQQVVWLPSWLSL